jgi:Uma2 family endonuclease
MPMHMTMPFTTERELGRWLLEVLPKQGCWSEEEYLWLTERTNRLVEYTDGYLEVLPVPTDKHQSVLEFLYVLFIAFVHPRGGKMHLAGIRLKVSKDRFRGPDLLLVKDAQDPRRQNRFWTGADLSLEVVSKDKPARDLVEKRNEYAMCGVPEYWIVNPQDENITVLKLDQGTYVEHGVFHRGNVATSLILPGFTVNVDAVFDAV